MMGNSPALPIAPGNTNRISDGPNQIRLPIGRTVVDKSPTGSKSYFWLTIPTNTGGQLTLVHWGRGTITLLAADGTTILAGGSGDRIVHSVQPPFYGILYVLAEGGSRREVSCDFQQVSFARDGTNVGDSPFIPWDFFFWPTPRKFNDGTSNEFAAKAEDILRRYAIAYGRDPVEAAKAEHDNHGVDVGEAWQGHCHFAAAASIIFETPSPQVIGSTSFTDEEVKLLAAEWFGNFGQKKLVFNLEKGSAPFPQLKDIYYPMLFKPSAPRTPATLKAAIESYNTKTRAMDAEFLSQFAFHREKNLSATIDTWFGELAAEFYQMLLDEVRTKKQALIADLRAAGEGNGPQEVWNHAIFYYKATFEEVAPDDDPQYMQVTIRIVANADISPPSGVLPGFIESPSHVDVDNSAYQSRKQDHVLHLAFESGKLAGKGDPRNKWVKSLEMNGGRGTEIHAPRWVSEVSISGTSPGTPLNQPGPGDNAESLKVGNVVVGLDMINGSPPSKLPPLLKLRKRYKK